MLAKLSQGVTTVIVGNCGISAAPVKLAGEPPDPMNLLGDADAFRYPTFAEYVAAVDAAKPAVNVAALAGHTALRNNHMDRLDRAATATEIQAMREQLIEALDAGALGLSTGLAYLSANSAPPQEVLSLAEPLAAAGAVYATHMRTEAEAIVEAMREAFEVGRQCRVPVVISHLKCAGVANWGRSDRDPQDIGYGEGRSTGTVRLLSLCGLVEHARHSPGRRARSDRYHLVETSSGNCRPDAGADCPRLGSYASVRRRERLQPAGAIYHCMSEDDVRRILQHPATMIGSDGLPHDPLPHPRLWGTFPRVLGYYCREQGLFPLANAVHKMTGLPAQRFGLDGRGSIREGAHADLVLFDPETIKDTATFSDPIRCAEGIAAVWVNGVLSYKDGDSTGQRGGRFVPRPRKRQ